MKMLCGENLLNMKHKPKIPDLSQEIRNSRDKNTSPDKSSPMREKTPIFKPARVVFLGSSRAGKTSIIQRFLHNRFTDSYNPTIEDIHTSKFLVRGKLVPVEFMDTSGSCEFPAMLRLCISKASAFVIVFSNDSAESLKEAGNLLDQIKSVREDYAPFGSICNNKQIDSYSNVEESSTDLTTASPPVVVVCNKSDIPPADTKVTEGAIMEWLITRGLKPSQFVYASAKDNESIQSIFKSLWQQNEITHAMEFESFEPKRRYSVSSSGDNENNLGNSPHKQENDQNSKIKPGLFRSSLRLSRRTSSKGNRGKPDLIRIECNIS